MNENCIDITLVVDIMVKSTSPHYQQNWLENDKYLIIFGEKPR